MGVSRRDPLRHGLFRCTTFCQTRISDLDQTEPCCIGLPQAEGVMGLISDGQGYFKNTKSIVAQYGNVPDRLPVEAQSVAPSARYLSFRWGGCEPIQDCSPISLASSIG